MSKNHSIDKIILATRNQDKIEEMKSALSNLDIELKSTRDYHDLPEVEEDQLTLEGNALKKARIVYKETNLPALADDTGLEVDALDGRPGVHSARYAGEDASYEENVEKLLEELAGVEREARLAQFRTIMAFVSDIGSFTFEGICRGLILEQPKGEKGFGYDPVFQPRGYNQTFAQLEAEEKNKISHRGKAIRKFVNWMEAGTA